MLAYADLLPGVQRLKKRPCSVKAAIGEEKASCNRSSSLPARNLPYYFFRAFSRMRTMTVICEPSLDTKSVGRGSPISPWAIFSVSPSSS